MKKNAMLKIAAILMVAVLLTTCAISSTFAKYVTTDKGSDSARVAKWGVTLDLSVAGAFANKYENGTAVAGLALENVDIVAPGTSKEDAVTLSVTGTPEVSTIVSITDMEGGFNYVTLENWYYTLDPNNTPDDPSDDVKTDYCPIVITVNDKPFTAADAATLEFNVNEYIKGLVQNKKVGAGESVGNTLNIDWKWAFEAGKDAEDTNLGNAAAAGQEITIKFSFDVSIAQDGPAVAE